MAKSGSFGPVFRMGYIAEGPLFLNHFTKFFVFPGGITTILMMILFTSTLNYFLFALNAKQIEKIILPNALEIASSEEIK